MATLYVIEGNAMVLGGWEATLGIHVTSFIYMRRQSAARAPPGAYVGPYMQTHGILRLTMVIANS